ncbi:MAG: GNAT family N-acetyltransferase [Chloroflexota bacterium]
MTLLIRLATVQDAGQIQAIYSPIVSQTAISFEIEPPTIEEMRRRVTNTLEYLPWLVCAQGEKILGYAYASQHRSRATYRWSVDVRYISTRKPAGVVWDERCTDHSSRFSPSKDSTMPTRGSLCPTPPVLDCMNR